ncbi:MAG: DUF1801 domain-containing protein [Verrucomicrobiales bacterium]|nr:DUF1801 domain-containing protein [Verrucomicrobiales bacterium]
MKSGPAGTMDAYIAGFPPEIRAVLEEVRETIHRAAPEATEAIKYQIPTFVMGGNLVHFAAFKKHLGFYPTPSAIRAFARELAGYQTAKGSIQFPFDQPIPFPLIQRMVEFRVAEMNGMTSAKSRSAGRGRRGKV